MKLIEFDERYINIDRIDAIARGFFNSETTDIYIGGTKFSISDKIENVLKKIEETKGDSECTRKE